MSKCSAHNTNPLSAWLQIQRPTTRPRHFQLNNKTMPVPKTEKIFFSSVKRKPQYARRRWPQVTYRQIMFQLVFFCQGLLFFPVNFIFQSPFVI